MREHVIQSTSSNNELTEKVIEGHTILDVDQVDKAVTALKDYIDKQNSGKKQLFEPEDNIWLFISLEKMPFRRRVKPYRIPLSHPIYGDSEICLIVPDKEKAQYKLQMLPNVKKILQPSDLREKYCQYESRRKLLASYDLFLCDERLSLVLRRLLGKTFLNQNKFPIPICLRPNHGTKKQLSPAKTIAIARDSTYLYIPQGTCINVRVAKTLQPSKEVRQNILRSINAIVKHIPNGWKNIQELCVKTSTSVALPFFVNLPTFGENLFEEKKVEEKVEKKGKKKVEKKS